MRRRGGEWLDVVRYGLGDDSTKINFCPQGLYDSNIRSWNAAAERVPGLTLRVYVGTFGRANKRPLVCFANCIPKHSYDKEKYGRAVFVGPRDEAIEQAKAHVALWLFKGW